MGGVEGYDESVGLYQRWLGQRSRSALRGWNNRLSDDAGAVAGAIGEAVVWHWLSCERVDSIDLGEQQGKGPDFRCCVRGEVFFVEVTALSDGTVWNKTGLSASPHGGARMFGPLTQAIDEKVTEKEDRQRSLRDLDGPLLLFVTLTHFTASTLCVQRHFVQDLLTGTPHLKLEMGGGSGSECSQVSRLENALFVGAVTDESRNLITRRNWLSGVLVGGFGVAGPRVPVLGVLHPKPTHEWQPEPGWEVPFARLRWPLGKTLSVTWSDGEAAATPISQAMPQRPRVVLPSDISFSDLDLDRLRG